MTECTQIEWASPAATWLGAGDAILGAPRRNVLGTTALTPPVMDGIERAPMTNTIEAQPPEPLDIMRALNKLDSLEAYRAAERVRQQILRDETILVIAQLVVDGRMDDARAVAAGAWDLLWGGIYKTRLPPDDYLAA